MKIFGYQIKREEDKINQEVISPPENSDGSLEISSNFTNFYNTALGIDNALPQDEVKLITKYRELASQPEIKRAIDDIINDAFAYDENDYPVSLNLDKIDNISDKVKEKIQEEFNYILNLLNIRQDAYEIFRRWYVDGRLFYQMIIDKDNPSEGLKEVRYIDPRKIRKVREPVQKTKDMQMIYSVEVNKKYRYYYIYNPTGISNQTSTQGIKIAPDSIAHANSGVLDVSNRVMLSHLQDAIRPYNQYRMMKDASIIYYHTRAPERRLFNVEVGNLPKVRAEQYLKEVMDKFRRKPTYDPTTGEIRDAKREMTMNEDFWFARREGKGTTIDILAGGANLSDINEVVQFYKDELFESLNVPISRYKESNTVGLGRSSEITRDELKFSKFVSRCRKRFSNLFDDMLGTQLVLKNIISIADWNELKNEIYYDFLEDNAHTELKWAEIIQNRMETMATAQDYIGTYFSKAWAAKNILQMTDEEYEEEKKLMKAEREEEIKDPTTPNPLEVGNGPFKEFVDEFEDKFELLEQKIEGNKELDIILSELKSDE